MNADRWNEIFRGATPTHEEMYEALSRKITCARCGRGDLPLGLMREHNKSCAFECGHLIAGAAIDTVEQQNQKIDDQIGRIKDLESSLRDVLMTISWFEGWLAQEVPAVAYSYRAITMMKNSINKVLCSTLDGTEKG